jgi:sugar transferase (PEP-CTERM system associated)
MAMTALVGGGGWRNTLLVVVDHVLFVAAVLAAVWLRLGYSEWVFGWHLLWRASLVALVLQVAMHYCDLYDLRTIRNRRNLFVGALQAVAAASLALAILYYWLPDLMVGRSVLILAATMMLGLVVAWRIAFEWLSSRMGPSERLLIVGMSSAAIELARELYDRRHHLGVELVGFVDADESRTGLQALEPRMIGAISDIPAIIETRKVDRVVVSLANARGKFSMDTLLEIKLRAGVRFDHLASIYEEYTGKIAVENLRPSWLIFSPGFRKTRLLVAAKRAMDLILASIGLVLAIPVMLVAAVMIKLTSPGPVFYHQRRVGQHGRVVTVHKFRSMRTDAELTTGAVWAQQNDPRVTSFGRFMRKTRLDEIPQLWNVFVGEMSLVGPRPERPEFVAKLTQEIPFYGQRHVVKPGLTGWAQVRYAYGASVDDAIQKLQYDLFYIKHLSLALDLYIVFETAKTVVLRRGS